MQAIRNFLIRHFFKIFWELLHMKYNYAKEVTRLPVPVLLMFYGNLKKLQQSIPSILICKCPIA